MEPTLLVIATILVGFVINALQSKPGRRGPRHRRSRARPVQQSKRAKQNLPDGKTQTLVGSAWITDGDSITIKKREIRLFGIDAPEMKHPYGKRAKWALHELCKGQKVRAEVVNIDHFGRTVARCYLPDGRDLSAEMVKLGLALDWAKHSGGAYKDLETHDAREKLYLADARQKGHMYIWRAYEAQQEKRYTS